MTCKKQKSQSEWRKYIKKFYMKRDKWISVKDKEPPYEEWVLLYCKNEEEFPPDPQTFVGRSGQYGEKNEYESAHGDGYVRSGTKITHWMPLPEPPQKHE